MTVIYVNCAGPDFFLDSFWRSFRPRFYAICAEGFGVRRSFLGVRHCVTESRGKLHFTIGTIENLAANAGMPATLAVPN